MVFTLVFFAFLVVGNSISLISTFNANRFGIAIRPLQISANDHISSGDLVQPIKEKMTYKH